MHSKISRALRVISFILVISFLSEQLSFAAGEIKPKALNLFERPKVSLSFPESVARVEDVWIADSPATSRGINSKRKAENGTIRESSIPLSALRSPLSMLYLLSDAHTNPSGQLNLSKTLDILLEKDKSLRYVFSEAGVGDNSLSYLRNYGTPKKREEVALSFIKKGFLHGHEYLNLTSDREFYVWGVEDKALYLKALEAYKSVAKDRDKFQSYLDKINQAITTLKPRLLNPSLLELDSLHEKFLKEDISLTDYLEKLQSVIPAQAGIYPDPRLKHSGMTSPSFYPHLTALKSLKSLESTIDFPKAQEEQQKAILSLSKEDQQELLEYKSGRTQSAPTLISSNDHKAEQAFFLLLEQKLLAAKGQEKCPSSVDEVRRQWTADPSSEKDTSPVLLPYPNLALYFHYLRQAKALNPQEILKEQKALETEVFASLTTTKDEETLLKCQTKLRLLKKLFNLTLTPEEYKEHKDSGSWMVDGGKNNQSTSHNPPSIIHHPPSAFTITHLTGFLNKKIMDLKDFYDRTSFLEPGYDDILKASETFYELTTQRDEKFVENMLQRLNENQAEAGRRKAEGKANTTSSAFRPLPSAVLITGGFHTPNLKSMLKSRGISYISIQPQVFQETNQKRYESILMNLSLPSTAPLKSASMTFMPPLLRSPLPQMVEGSALVHEKLAQTFRSLGLAPAASRLAVRAISEELELKIIAYKSDDPVAALKQALPEIISIARTKFKPGSGKTVVPVHLLIDGNEVTTADPWPSGKILRVLFNIEDESAQPVAISPPPAVATGPRFGFNATPSLRPAFAGLKAEKEMLFRRPAESLPELERRLVQILSSTERRYINSVGFSILVRNTTKKATFQWLFRDEIASKNGAVISAETQALQIVSYLKSISGEWGSVLWDLGLATAPNVKIDEKNIVMLVIIPREKPGSVGGGQEPNTWKDGDDPGSPVKSGGPKKPDSLRAGLRPSQGPGEDDAPATAARLAKGREITQPVSRASFGMELAPAIRAVYHEARAIQTDQKDYEWYNPVRIRVNLVGKQIIGKEFSHVLFDGLFTDLSSHRPSELKNGILEKIDAYPSLFNIPEADRKNLRYQYQIESECSKKSANVTITITLTSLKTIPASQLGHVAPDFEKALGKIQLKEKKRVLRYPKPRERVVLSNRRYYSIEVKKYDNGRLVVYLTSPNHSFFHKFVRHLSGPIHESARKIARTIRKELIAGIVEYRKAKVKFYSKWGPDTVFVENYLDAIEKASRTGEAVGAVSAGARFAVPSFDGMDGLAEAPATQLSAGLWPFTGTVQTIERAVVSASDGFAFEKSAGRLPLLLSITQSLRALSGLQAFIALLSAEIKTTPSQIKLRLRLLTPLLQLAESSQRTPKQWPSQSQALRSPLWTWLKTLFDVLKAVQTYFLASSNSDSTRSLMESQYGYSSAARLASGRLSMRGALREAVLFSMVALISGGCVTRQPAPPQMPTAPVVQREETEQELIENLRRLIARAEEAYRQGGFAEKNKVVRETLEASSEAERRKRMEFLRVLSLRISEDILVDPFESLFSKFKTLEERYQADHPLVILARTRLTKAHEAYRSGNKDQRNNELRWMLGDLESAKRIARNRELVFTVIVQDQGVEGLNKAVEAVHNIQPPNMRELGSRDSLDAWLRSARGALKAQNGSFAEMIEEAKGNLRHAGQDIELVGALEKIVKYALKRDPVLEAKEFLDALDGITPAHARLAAFIREDALWLGAVFMGISWAGLGYVVPLLDNPLKILTEVPLGLALGLSGALTLYGVYHWIYKFIPFIKLYSKHPQAMKLFLKRLKSFNRAINHRDELNESRGVYEALWPLEKIEASDRHNLLGPVTSDDGAVRYLPEELVGLHLGIVQVNWRDPQIEPLLQKINEALAKDPKTDIRIFITGVGSMVDFETTKDISGHRLKRTVSSTRSFDIRVMTPGDPQWREYVDNRAVYNYVNRELAKQRLVPRIQSALGLSDADRWQAEKILEALIKTDWLDREGHLSTTYREMSKEKEGILKSMLITALSLRLSRDPAPVLLTEMDKHYGELVKLLKDLDAESRPFAARLAGEIKLNLIRPSLNQAVLLSHDDGQELLKALLEEGESGILKVISVSPHGEETVSSKVVTRNGNVLDLKDSPTEAYRKTVWPRGVFLISRKGDINFYEGNENTLPSLIKTQGYSKIVTSQDILSKHIYGEDKFESPPFNPLSVEEEGEGGGEGDTPSMFRIRVRFTRNRPVEALAQVELLKDEAPGSFDFQPVKDGKLSMLVVPYKLGNKDLLRAHHLAGELVARLEKSRLTNETLVLGIFQKIVTDPLISDDERLAALMSPSEAQGKPFEGSLREVLKTLYLSLPLYLNGRLRDVSQRTGALTSGGELAEALSEISGLQIGTGYAPSPSLIPGASKKTDNPYQVKLDLNGFPAESSIKIFSQGAETDGTLTIPLNKLLNLLSILHTFVNIDGPEKYSITWLGTPGEDYFSIQKNAVSPPVEAAPTAPPPVLTPPIQTQNPTDLRSGLTQLKEALQAEESRLKALGSLPDDYGKYYLLIQGVLHEVDGFLDDGNIFVGELGRLRQTLLEIIELNSAIEAPEKSVRAAIHKFLALKILLGARFAKILDVIDQKLSLAQSILGDNPLREVEDAAKISERIKLLQARLKEMRSKKVLSYKDIALLESFVQSIAVSAKALADSIPATRKYIRTTATPEIEKKSARRLLYEVRNILTGPEDQKVDDVVKSDPESWSVLLLLRKKVLADAEQELGARLPIQRFVQESYYNFLKRRFLEKKTELFLSELDEPIRRLLEAAGLNAAGFFRRRPLVQKYLEAKGPFEFKHAFYLSEVLNREVFIPNGFLFLLTQTTRENGTDYGLFYGEVQKQQVVRIQPKTGEAIEVPIFTVRAKNPLRPDADQKSPSQGFFDSSRIVLDEVATADKGVRRKLIVHEAAHVLQNHLAGISLDLVTLHEKDPDAPLVDQMEGGDDTQQSKMLEKTAEAIFGSNKGNNILYGNYQRAPEKILVLRQHWIAAALEAQAMLVSMLDPFVPLSLHDSDLNRRSGNLSDPNFQALGASTHALAAQFIYGMCFREKKGGINRDEVREVLADEFNPIFSSLSVEVVPSAARFASLFKRDEPPTRFETALFTAIDFFRFVVGPLRKLFKFLWSVIQPIQTWLNRRNPKRLDGLVLPDGTKVRVLRDRSDYPKDNEEIQKRWDRHYAVFELKNETLGYTAYMAIHRLTKIQSKSIILNGQWRATGGTRILNYKGGAESALADAMELAKEMSFKNAGAEMEIGGSKCTIHLDNINPSHSPENPDKEKRDKVLISFAQAIEKIGNLLGGGVLTGQDMNISVDDAKLLFKHAPTSIVPYAAEGLCKAPTPPTAVGVVAAIETAVAYKFKVKDWEQSLQGKVIALQGLGGVGSLVLMPLLKKGAIVIASDMDAARIKKLLSEQPELKTFIDQKKLYLFTDDERGLIYNPFGEILNPKHSPYLRGEMKIDHVDVFVPCAVGEVLNDNTIPRLQQAGVKVIIGSANNASKDKSLHPKMMKALGILYVPDYITNAGGVTAVDGHLGHDISDEAIAERIGERVLKIILEAELKNKTPQEVADQQSQNFIDRQLTIAPLPLAAARFADVPRAQEEKNIDSKRLLELLNKLVSTAFTRRKNLAISFESMTQKEAAFFEELGLKMNLRTEKVAHASPDADNPFALDHKGVLHIGYKPGSGRWIKAFKLEDKRKALRFLEIVIPMILNPKKTKVDVQLNPNPSTLAKITIPSTLAARFADPSRNGDPTPSIPVPIINLTLPQVETTEGILQYGSPPEAIKANMQKGKEISVFVIPDPMYRNGVNYGDVEFPTYWKAYVKGGLQKGERIRVVATKQQIENLKIILQETIFGPSEEALRKSGLSDVEIQRMTREAAHFRAKDAEGHPYPLDRFVEFIPFDEQGAAQVGKVKISQAGKDKIRVEDEGKPGTELSFQTLQTRNATTFPKEPFKRPDFGVTFLGTSSGFDPKGFTTSLVVWTQGQGLLVDPLAYVSNHLEALGISPVDVPDIFLSHVHGDHDAGVLEYLLSGRRVRLFTTRVIYDSFLRKARAITGQDMGSLFDFVELKPGEKFDYKPGIELTVRDNFHPIPALGLLIKTPQGSLGYSGDTYYASPEDFEKLEKAGVLSRERREELSNFLWGADYVIHEAGIPPIHTTKSALEAGLAQRPQSPSPNPVLVVHTSQDPKAAGMELTHSHQDVVIFPDLAPDALQDVLAVQTVFFDQPLLDLRALLSTTLRGQRKSFKAEDYIVRKGEKGQSIFVIVSGEVDIIQDGQSVARLTRGNYFGEVAALLDVPRTADAKAVSDVTVLEFPADALEHLTQKTKRLRRLAENFKAMIPTLSNVELFNGLPSEVIQRLAGSLKRVKLEKGGVVMKQGDLGDAMFIIESGSLKVRIGEENGVTKIVRLLGPGDVIGEIALLKDVPRTATVTVESDEASLLELSRKDFDTLRQRYPMLTFLFTALAQKRLGDQAAESKDRRGIGAARLAVNLSEINRGWLEDPARTIEEVWEAVGVLYKEFNRLQALYRTYMGLFPSVSTDRGALGNNQRELRRDIRALDGVIFMALSTLGRLVLAVSTKDFVDKVSPEEIATALGAEIIPGPISIRSGEAGKAISHAREYVLKLNPVEGSDLDTTLQIGKYLFNVRVDIPQFLAGLSTPYVEIPGGNPLAVLNETDREAVGNYIASLLSNFLSVQTTLGHPDEYLHNGDEFNDLRVVVEYARSEATVTIEGSFFGEKIKGVLKAEERDFKWFDAKDRPVDFDARYRAQFQKSPELHLPGMGLKMNLNHLALDALMLPALFHTPTRPEILEILKNKEIKLGEVKDKLRPIMSSFLDAPPTAARFAAASRDGDLALSTAPSTLAARLVETDTSESERYPWATERFLKLQKETGIEFVGEAPATLALLEKVRNIARSGTYSPVLISGASGTGKELVWRLLVALNSERVKLFGEGVTDDYLQEKVAVLNVNDLNASSNVHEFLYGNSQREGILHKAVNGFLILDGIEDATSIVQGVLLRITEGAKIKSGVAREIDLRKTRIIATANKAFPLIPPGYRDDLIRRFIISIDVPSLRDRSGDIPLLYEYFAHKASVNYGLKWKPLSPEAVGRLQDQTPVPSGEVRGLQRLTEERAIDKKGEAARLAIDILKPEDKQVEQLKEVEYIRRVVPSAEFVTVETIEQGIIGGARFSTGRITPSGFLRLGDRSCYLGKEYARKEVDLEFFTPYDRNFFPGEEVDLAEVDEHRMVRVRYRGKEIGVFNLSAAGRFAINLSEINRKWLEDPARTVEEVRQAVELLQGELNRAPDLGRTYTSLAPQMSTDRGALGTSQIELDRDTRTFSGLLSAAKLRLKELSAASPVRVVESSGRDASEVLVEAAQRVANRPVPVSRVDLEVPATADSWRKIASDIEQFYGETGKQETLDLLREALNELLRADLPVTTERKVRVFLDEIIPELITNNNEKRFRKILPILKILLLTRSFWHESKNYPTIVGRLGIGLAMVEHILENQKGPITPDKITIDFDGESDEGARLVNVAALIKMLKGDKDFRKRAEAATELGKTEGTNISEIGKALLSALGDSDPTVRKAVVLSLTVIGASNWSIVLALHQVSESDSDLGVRDTAKRSLAMIAVEFLYAIKEAGIAGDAGVRAIIREVSIVLGRAVKNVAQFMFAAPEIKTQTTHHEGLDKALIPFVERAFQYALALRLQTVEIMVGQTLYSRPVNSRFNTPFISATAFIKEIFDSRPSALSDQGKDYEISYEGKNKVSVKSLPAPTPPAARLAINRHPEGATRPKDLSVEILHPDFVGTQNDGKFISRLPVASPFADPAVRQAIQDFHVAMSIPQGPRLVAPKGQQVPIGMAENEVSFSEQTSVFRSFIRTGRDGRQSLYAFDDEGEIVVHVKDLKKAQRDYQTKAAVENRLTLAKQNLKYKVVQDFLKLESLIPVSLKDLKGVAQIPVSKMSEGLDSQEDFEGLLFFLEFYFTAYKSQAVYFEGLDSLEPKRKELVEALLKQLLSQEQRTGKIFTEIPGPEEGTIDILNFVNDTYAELPAGFDSRRNLVTHIRDFSLGDVANLTTGLAVARLTADLSTRHSVNGVIPQGGKEEEALIEAFQESAIPKILREFSFDRQAGSQLSSKTAYGLMRGFITDAQIILQIAVRPILRLLEERVQGFQAMMAAARFA